MKKSMFLLLFLGLIGFIYSCGGGGGGTSPSGNVSFYVTDAMSDQYRQVAATLNSVSLVNSESGEQCVLLDNSTSVDIATLANEILLLGAPNCPAGNYDRIHAELSNSVVITNSAGVTQTCTFVSYNQNSNNPPDVLNCNGNNCTLDVNGAVNVFANQNNKLGLDFELKNFVVNDFPNPDCTVTMKVSPLNASDMMGKMGQGYMESVEGRISLLNATDKTFTLSGEDRSFTVDYNGVSQQGIDKLLPFAQDNNLEVRVLANSIDLGSAITATGIYVMDEGMVSNLDASGMTFVLGNGITVDYSSALVEGETALANGVQAEVSLMGTNGTAYIANKVEVDEPEAED